MNGRKKMSRFLRTLSDLALYTLVGACFVFALTWVDATFAQSRLSVISVVVQKATATPRLSFAQASVNLGIGDAIANPALSDQPASKGAITYGSSDEAVARVAADGSVTAVAAGTATITATQAADLPAFEAGSGSYPVTVVGPLAASVAVASQVWLVGEPAASVVPVTASGGVGKLRYAIAPALPAGLAFSADTGALSGAATVESLRKSYTVTVSDGATPSHTDSATFDLTIGPAFVAQGTDQYVAFDLNTYSLVEALVIVRGGIGAFNAAVTPPLPAGLKLSVAKDPSSPVSEDYIVNIDGTPSVVSPRTVYTVTVTDSAGLPHSYTSTFEVSVAGPLSATVTAGNRIAAVGEAINYRPITGAGGVPDLSVYDYAVLPALPAGLAMDRATGAITGAASGVAPATVYTVTLTAGRLPSATASFTLEIVDGLAATTVISTQTVVMGDPLNSTPVTAAGGVGKPHFAITPPLPAGLSMDTDTGAITGAATGESKATVYTVTVTDDAANSATATFSLEVNAGLSTWVFNHSETHRVTDQVDYTPPITSGGVRPYHYTVTPALPAGLAMNAGTGAITGAATAPSTLTTYTYTVTDSATRTHSTTGTFSLLIAPALTVTTVISTMSVAADAIVTDTPVKAEGGLGLHHFSVQPALPAGLTMDELSGTIKNVPGTPIALSPAKEYTVTVTDSATPLQTATAMFTLAVDGGGIAVTLNTPTMSQPINEPLTAYAPVTASGGVGALSYDVAPPLPDGLTMDPATGVISGTPVVEQMDGDAARYTVTITDGASPAHTVQRQFGLATFERPTATVLERTKAYMIWDTVNYKPVEGGGAGGRMLHYRMLHGGLPAGLTMDADTGVVSGTALEVSPSNTFAVAISDPLGGDSRSRPSSTWRSRRRWPCTSHRTPWPAPPWESPT